MNQRQMSCSIAVEGAVKGCPARLAVWYDTVSYTHLTLPTIA